MTGDQLTNALLAIGLGVVAGVILMVPFVAISYRRRGALTLGRSLVWASVLVYFWAIWTYTLLPLPAPDALVCVGTNTQPGAFLHDLADAYRDAGGSARALLTSPVVLQLVLNVALFVPLGFFVRWLGGRGILTAALAGLGLSCVIELTQLTGVWGIYDCAYRVFDVDDLLMNTAGAVLGSLLAMVVPRRHLGMDRSPDADLPRPVTKPRRLLAMLLDVVGSTILAFAVAVPVQAWLLYVVDDRDTALETTLSSDVGAWVALATWLAVVLATGRTVGDLAVRLRYRTQQPTALARALRFVTGIGGYLLLGLLPDAWLWTTWLYALAALVAVLATRHGRGLPGLALRADLIDDREHR